jgi:hypothetical protein
VFYCYSLLTWYFFQQVDKKLLNTVKGSIRQGFSWATREGPLCEERKLHSSFSWTFLSSLPACLLWAGCHAFLLQMALASSSRANFPHACPPCGFYAHALLSFTPGSC